MKKVTVIIFFIILQFFQLSAQPQGINYQGVARDSLGNTIVNQNIKLRLSILESSITGLPVYVETHTLTTNISGLFNLTIGNGTVVTGSFINIPWGLGG